MIIWVPKEHNSGNRSELRTTINVNEKYYAMYQIKTGPVRAGDIIQVLAEAHVTNDLHKAPYNVKPADTNVYITAAVIANTVPNATASDQAGGFHYEITEPGGQNFDNRVHHFRLVTCGSVTITADHPDGLYVTYCGKSGSTKAKSNWKLTLDDDQGRLAVIHHAQTEVTP
jgi:ribosomal protein S27AE